MMKPPHKGFTLVETLVAISILMISIVGPYYSVYKAVQTTYIARDKLIATALSQEGIEYVRNKRDSNYLYNLANNPIPLRDWLFGLTPCKGAGVKCTVDVTGVAPATCSNGTCAPLNISSPSNVYTQGAGEATRYTRSVNITDVDANETVVTVTVSWVNSHITNSIVVTEHLYNWL